MHIFYINSILLIRPNEKICAILVSKVFGNVKNPYIINQNHIFKKKYFEVISG
jgi:rRNA processing protein Gar1